MSDTPGLAEVQRPERVRARQDEMLGAIDVGLWYCDLPFDELVWDRKVKEHFWLPADARVTIDTFYARIHPDDRGPTRAAIDRSIAEHGPYDIEYRTVAPDGHPEAGTVRWVRAIGYTAYDAAGRPIRFDGVTVDVTAREAARRERERLLAATEAAHAAADLERRRLLATLDQLPVGVHVAEAPSGRLVLDNAALRAIVGEAPASQEVAAYSADYAGFYPAGHPRAGEQVTSHEWPLARTLATGSSFTDDLVEIQRSDGTHRLVRISATPVRDAAGDLVGGVATVVDVTERERLLAAAQEARAAADAANAAKAQFLATMSHELRTPLNAIGGYVQLLDMGLHGPVTDDQRAALARVHVAHTRLLALITDILNYAKLESGRVEYDVRPVDVGDVVREVAPLVEPQMRAKGLVFDVRLSDTPCVVSADREKLGQVLVNLLSNAVKFTPSPHPTTGVPGRVAVSVDAGGDLVYVRVADTGIGIPHEQQERIFEPFVQVRAGYTQGTEGTGLGLAISRELARGMGGDLRVSSEPGEGATLTVVLRRAS